jgi:hypothetical protein
MSEESILPENVFEGRIDGMDIRWGEIGQERFLRQTNEEMRAKIKGHTEASVYSSAKRLQGTKAKILYGHLSFGISSLHDT